MSHPFNRFDFDNNQSFKDYLKRFDPPPTGAALEKLKKKWYKQVIDTTFDPDQYDAQKQQGQPKFTPQQETQREQYARQQQPLPFMYQVEGFLKLIFFPMLVLVFIPGKSIYLNGLSGIISLMAIGRMVGRPQFSQAYLLRLMPNEFLGNLLYVVSLMAGRGPLVYQLPLMIHYFVGVTEFLSRVNLYLPDLTMALNNVRQHRNYFMLNKQKIEVYLFAYSVLSLVMGYHSFIQLMIHYQFLSLKSKTNPNMQSAQQQINWEYHSWLVNNNKLPGPVRNIFKTVWTGYEKLMNLF